ncbi:MAG: Gldg family protein [Deltaproteobacteria bacterium]|nr:Gldg family protein [Deltaproteobacteria bacterium]
MSKIFTVTKKELWSYFSSPTAYIFLGTFLLVNLFTFFWVEKFFSRNIADLRPLFQWLPLLLIFLIATLTMKMWSEERRIGTIEFLMTLPVKTSDLVLGKFFACMALVAVSLLLTLGLAFSVGHLGNVDWGPVTGAYLASLLLASAYTAVGLYVSSKTQSQIVSLIVTTLVCSAFYLVGSDVLLNFLGNKPGELLKLFGTGSRFDSISRGVIDFRDIYYYLSLAAVFLVANTFALDKLKWSPEARKGQYSVRTGVVALLVMNVLAANFWLSKVESLRLDITESKMYSISEATQNVIQQLEEPLLIRGYFSSRTHPLLAPLVPTVRDLLAEYQLVSKGRIRTEFVDPRDDEEIEAEANRKYSIEPVPFQVADRHSAAMVNSYFNIVVQYGTQFEVLSFNDLIDVKYDGTGNIDVRLRNLEYDITRSIKKTMQAFRNTDSFFASLNRDIKFVAYVSEAKLPKQLTTLFKDIKQAVSDYEKNSGGRLSVRYLDPSQDEAIAKNIADHYGFMPQSMSLFAEETFYFYLTLEDGEKIYSLGVPEDFSVTGFKNGMEAALKRMMPGFLRTVGLYTPPSGGGFNPMMGQMGGGKQYQMIQKKLEENYSTKTVDLDAGMVPDDVDILVLVAPENFNAKQVFAVDQFLMKGGTVILASSPVVVNRQARSFVAETKESGLEQWLEHMGLSLPKELVLDMQNVGFPSIRKRVVRGITIREPQVSPYPFFVDLREKGLNRDSGITSGLGQVTIAWPSPIEVDKEKNKERTVVELLKSSAQSWRTKEIEIEPNSQVYPELGFAISDEKKPSSLAVLLEGRFESYFKGKSSPLIAKEDKKDELTPAKEDKKEEESVLTSVIEKSPNIARLILFASNEFVADDTLQISGMLSGTQYINPLQLVENAVDWSVQDRALLAIRSRSYFARTLVPLNDDQKRDYEIYNYLFALLGLFAVWGTFKYRQRKSHKLFKALNLV